MDDQNPSFEGRGGMSLAIWKGLAMTLGLLLISIFAVVNFVFGLRFGQWPGIAQFLFIGGLAGLCVAVGRFISKRSNLGMD